MISELKKNDFKSKAEIEMFLNIVNHKCKIIGCDGLHDNHAYTKYQFAVASNRKNLFYMKKCGFFQRIFIEKGFVIPNGDGTYIFKRGDAWDSYKKAWNIPDIPLRW